jgi:hypothetical protein
MSPARILPPGHPDRFTTVEEAIEPAYQKLVDKMVRAGIDEREVALAIESLAQAHLDTIIANEKTEAQIDLVRRGAGMSERGAPPERYQWSVAVGAAIWAVALFSLAFMAIWALIRFLR